MLRKVCLAGWVLGGLASNYSLAQTSESNRTAAIEEALKQGAHIVECTGGICRDQTTDQLVERRPNGVYLVFPNDAQHQHDIEEAQRKLRATNM